METSEANFKSTVAVSKPIHTFTGHIKSVTSLMPFKENEELLMSAALDATVRIWSLSQF